MGLLWLKALHIIAVISWMAGLLYLPRLFIYHVDAPAGSVQSETFKVMERRLFRYIMRPAMIVTWLTGPTLLWQLGMYRDGWAWAKLALVAGLTVMHEVMGVWRRDFENDKNTRSALFYRYVNEAPTLLMIAIVILVVVKPF